MVASAARPSRSRRTTSSSRSRRRCSTPSTRTASAPRPRSTSERVELSAKLGENIVVAGAARFEAVDGGARRRVRPSAGEQARRARPGEAAATPSSRASSRCTSRSADPQWIGREEVPADVVAAEREIYANSDEVQSKPEEAREKIVEGMLNKRFFGGRTCSLEQEWIHDASKTVGAGAEGGGRGAYSSTSASRSQAEHERRPRRPIPRAPAAARLPARPPEALGRGADGRRASTASTSPSSESLAAEIAARARRRGRGRDRRRRRELLPRPRRRGRGDGPRDRRLRGHARDAAQRARAPGRARAGGRRHARAVGARRAPRWPSRTSAGARSATSRRAAS